MIEYINGTIEELTPTQVTIDVHQIGYLLNISLNTYTAIQGKNAAKLYVHEDIREDAYLLFGFYSAMERELFRLLISISGVGGQTARMVLSAFTPQDLVNIIGNEDVRSLKSVKGIGPKAAQRIIVELKDKIVKLGVVPNTTDVSSHKVVVSETVKEAVSALQTLGFAPAPTQKVVAQIAKEAPEATVEELIKKALKML